MLLPYLFRFNCINNTVKLFIWHFGKTKNPIIIFAIFGTFSLDFSESIQIYFSLIFRPIITRLRYTLFSFIKIWNTVITGVTFKSIIISSIQYVYELIAVCLFEKAFDSCIWNVYVHYRFSLCSILLWYNTYTIYTTRPITFGHSLLDIV